MSNQAKIEKLQKALAKVEGKYPAKAQLFRRAIADLQPTKKVEAKETEKVSKAAGITRAVIQGLSFGFGDEAEAALRSAFSDREYKEIRDEVRGQVDAFREQNPELAYGFEIAAGAGASFIPVIGQAGRAGQLASAAGRAATTTVPTAAKVASTALKTPIRRSAAGGALYGAGAAEEMSDIPAEAATGALLGAGFAAAAPQVGKAARELGKKVDISVGQKFGGLMGATEELMTGFGRVGKELGTESKIFRESFTVNALETAANQMGKSLPKVKSKGKDAIVDKYASLKKMFDDQYDEVVNEINVPFAELYALTSKGHDEILDGLSEKAQERFKPEINRILKSLKGKKLSTGEYIKSLQSELKTRGSKLIGNDNIDVADTGRALFDLQSVLMKNLEDLAERNPANKAAVEKLKTVNTAYRTMLPVEKSIERAGASKAFSPEMLDDEIKRQSLSASKYIQGQSIPALQKTLDQIEAVRPTLGEAVPQTLGAAAIKAATTGISSLGDIAAAGSAPLIAGAAPFMGMNRQLRPIVKGALEIPSGLATPAAGLFAEDVREYAEPRAKIAAYNLLGY